MNTLSRAALLLGTVVGCAAAPSALAWDVYGGASYLLLEADTDRGVTTPGRQDRPDTIQRVVRTSSDGGAIMGHLGLWLNESFALEIRGGFPGDEVEISGDDDHTVELDSYIGAYIIARAKPFSWLDMVFPVGAAQVKLLVPASNAEGTQTVVTETDTAKISYGIDLRFKLGELIADPDTIIGSISLNAGFMVLGNDREADVRAYNGGLQLGFSF